MKFNLKINTDLTPQTARKLGYIFIGDVVYEPHHPTVDIIAIHDLVQAGFKLGCSSFPDPTETYSGLYRPMTEHDYL